MASKEELSIIVRVRDLMSAPLRKIGTGLTRLQTLGVRAFGLMSKAALALAGSLGLILGPLAILGATRALVSAASQVETLRARLLVLTRDAAAADGILARMREFAASSPLDTSQILEAFVRLRSVGVAGAEEVTKAIANLSLVADRDIRDIAAAFVSLEKDPLRNIGLTLERTGDKAVLMSQRFRLEVGKTDAALRAGILEILGKEFPDAADVMAFTFKSRMATLRGAIFEVSADIGGLILPAISDSVASLSDWINTNRDSIVGFFATYRENLSDFLSTALEAWGAFAEYAKTGAEVANEGMQRAMREFADKSVKAIEELTRAGFNIFAAFFNGLLPVAGVAGTRLGASMAKAMLEELTRLLDGSALTRPLAFVTATLASGIDPSFDASEQVERGLASVTKHATAAAAAIRRSFAAGRDAGGSLLDFLNESELGDAYDRAKERIAAFAAGAETARTAAAGVTDTTTTMAGALNDAAGAAGDAEKAARKAAQALSDALSAVDARFGLRIDTAEARRDIAQLRVDRITDAGGTSAEIKAATVFVRDAEAEILAIKQEQLRARLAVLATHRDAVPFIEEERAAIAATLDLLQAQLEAVDKPKDPPLRFFESLAEGGKLALDELRVTAAEMTQSVADGFVDVANALRNNFVSSLGEAMEGTRSLGDAARETFVAMLRGIRDVILQMIALRIQAALVAKFGFAQGILTAGIGALAGPATSPGGVAPLTLGNTGPNLSIGGTYTPSFARGGIASGPILAMVGDNRSRREAMVPLPDGRRIPVDLRGDDGGGATTINVNVQAFDGASVERLFLSRGKEIGRALDGEIKRNPGLRKRLKAD